MADKIQISFSATQTCYYLLYNSAALVWSNSGGTGGFEVYNAANYIDYANDMTELDTGAGYYAGAFPAACPAGAYNAVAKVQAGVNPIQGDTVAGMGNYEWGGSAQVPLSSLASSGQIAQMSPVKLARGVMVRNFPFKLVSAADHVTPLLSGVVSGQISRDGGSFGPLQSGAFTELGLGWYSLQALTSGDLLANTAALSFNAISASGGAADQRDFAFVLQKVSGSP